jgi:hypothetical protein
MSEAKSANPCSAVSQRTTGCSRSIQNRHNKKGRRESGLRFMGMSVAKRTMNEADVREDVAMPLLRALGYAAGTANDIIREKALSYSNSFLGRKKKTDPPLRGRADYILTVLGAGSWTLEIKAEQVEIDQDAVEQALTYARHPQVSGSYAAVLNGKRFVVFHNTQRSDEPPLIDLPVEKIDGLAKALENTLSPNAIRADCSPPKVDLEMPLAPGLRSSATIAKISGKHARVSCHPRPPTPCPRCRSTPRV